VVFNPFNFPYFISPCDTITSEHKGREESTMSIIMALMGIDGIVLATDSRLTSHWKETSEIRDDEKKLWVLKSNIGLVYACNDLPFSKWLISKMESEVINLEENATLDFVDKIQKVSENINRYYSYYAQSHPMQFMVDTGGFDMEFIFAGYSGSKPKIISLSSQAKKANFACRSYPYCIAGLPNVANYWMIKFKEHLYTKMEGEDIPLQHTSVLRNIAIMIINEVGISSFEVGVKPIQMVIIKQSEVVPIDAQDIEALRVKIHTEITNGNEMLNKLKDIEL
jgi:20S proteasome alpha/beta subunit